MQVPKVKTLSLEKLFNGIACSELILKSFLIASILIIQTSAPESTKARVV